MHHSPAGDEGGPQSAARLLAPLSIIAPGLLSRNKATMLTKGAQPRPEDAITPEEEIKDPLVLEFLSLKDEYSEGELEDTLIRHLEAFFLELGNDFTLVGRQNDYAS